MNHYYIIVYYVVNYTAAISIQVDFNRKSSQAIAFF